MNAVLLTTGTIIQGYRVASGGAHDPRFPEGTIAIQQPIFKSLGVDLSEYHPGTLNVDVSPFVFEPETPWRTLPHVDWTEHFSPETFSFFRVKVIAHRVQVNGLLYIPHPSTKPSDHAPTPGVVEVLAPKIIGLEYGDQIKLSLTSGEGAFSAPQET